MAEPIRKIAPLRQETVRELPGDEEPGLTLLRWVEGPDGNWQQVEIPLTPEIFLNPRIDDQIMYGERHSRVGREIAGLLESRMDGQPDVTLFYEIKLLLPDPLPDPGPDVMVVHGVRPADRSSYSVENEGVPPSLIVEVVSPQDSKIRRTDLEKKPAIYQQAGVSEYIIVDSTRRDPRLRLLGYRLDGSGRYRQIAPDGAGRILSEIAGVWFQVSPEGERVLVFEHPSGRRVLNPLELKKKARREARARKAAEETASREAEARKAAEEEVARLRAEIERLRGER